MQPVVSQYERGARLQSGDQAIGDAQLAAETDASRLLRQQGVGAAIHDPAVEALGADDAPGSLASLEHAHGAAAPLQLVRRSQPRNASADDRHIDHGSHGDRCQVRVAARAAVWTYCASIWT